MPDGLVVVKSRSASPESVAPAIGALKAQVGALSTSTTTRQMLLPPVTVSVTSTAKITLEAAPGTSAALFQSQVIPAAAMNGALGLPLTLPVPPSVAGLNVRPPSSE